MYTNCIIVRRRIWPDRGSASGRLPRCPLRGRKRPWLRRSFGA